MAKIMSRVRHCCKTYPDVNEPYEHCHCASDERLIFYNITRCYGKRVTVFAVAIAAGDIIKYLFFFFHLYTLFSPSSDIQRVGEGHPSACLTNYSKGILFVDCISSSPLSCTFHAPFMQFQQLF